MSWPLLIAALGWLLAIAWSDWRSLRIPNSLVAGATAFLFVTAAFGVHPAGLSIWMAAAGAALVLALGLPLYAAGWVGAGDVKLLAVVGALVGPTQSLLAIWAMGALFAGAHVIGWQVLRQRFANLPLAPADPRRGRRRLPHGAHLALATGLVLCAPGMLPA